MVAGRMVCHYWSFQDTIRRPTVFPLPVASRSQVFVSVSLVCFRVLPVPQVIQQLSFTLGLLPFTQFCLSSSKLEADVLYIIQFYSSYLVLCLFFAFFLLLTPSPILFISPSNSSPFPPHRRLCISPFVPLLPGTTGLGFVLLGLLDLRGRLLARTAAMVLVLPASWLR